MELLINNLVIIFSFGYFDLTDLISKAFGSVIYELLALALIWYLILLFFRRLADA